MEIIAKSHIGKVRKDNQDYVQIFQNNEEHYLAVLCDGMGGHNAGDIASRMAADHLGNAWKHSQVSDERMIDWLQDQLNTENKRIIEKSKKFNGLEGMGTTIVGAAESRNKWTIFHIGDSRAYLLSGSVLQQLTEDHSFAEELVKRGEITAAEAVRHPKKNVLTRSMGAEGEAEADFLEVEKTSDSLLMLCSDGLTNMVPEEKIKNVLLSHRSLDEKAEMLVQKALDAGGKDNISVVLIGQFEEVPHINENR